MSIRKRGDKWQATLRSLDGRRISFTGSSKLECQRWERLQLANRDQGKSISSDASIKLDKYFEYYIEEIKTHKSKGTVLDYTSIYTRWIKSIYGNRMIKSIRYQDGVDFQKHLISNGLANRTTNNVFNLFKRVLIYATKGQGHRKQLAENPFNGIPELKIVGKDLNYWETEDIEKFLKFIEGNYWEDLIIVALNTGMRLGEVTGLRKNKVDFRKNVIKISQALKRTKTNGIRDLGPTKTGATRYFPMNKRIKDILKKRLKNLNPDDYIFTNEDGSTIDTSHFTRRIFTPLQKEAELDSVIWFHDLRHTYASHYMMNGGDIFTLKNLLGHSDLKSTQIYAHLSPKYMQNSAEIVIF